MKRPRTSGRRRRYIKHTNDPRYENEKKRAACGAATVDCLERDDWDGFLVGNWIAKELQGMGHLVNPELLVDSTRRAFRVIADMPACKIPVDLVREIAEQSGKVHGEQFAAELSVGMESLDRARETCGLTCPCVIDCHICKASG